MTTEQYAMGYETGYQDGWNSAMESLNASPQPTKPAGPDTDGVTRFNADSGGGGVGGSPFAIIYDGSGRGRGQRIPVELLNKALDLAGVPELPAGYESVEIAITQRDELLVALRGMLAIVNESRGVAGYHLNGDTAEWDEFDEVDAARAIIAAYEAKNGIGGQV